MMITDKFVMLNLPKTGSTFARAVLKQLYGRKYRQLSLAAKLTLKLKLSPPLLQELQTPNTKFKMGLKARRDPHGGYCEIPDEHKSKVVFSIVRDPFQRLLSGYTYRHWVKWPPVPKEVLIEHFPFFPDISIDDYVNLLKLSSFYRTGLNKADVCIGSFSLQFIQMFFKNPSQILGKLTDEYIDSETIYDDMADITFLRQEHLRNDIKGFLQKFGFSTADLSIIDTMKDENVSAKSYKERDRLITPTVINYINNEERLMSKLLKNKGIDYPTIGSHG